MRGRLESSMAPLFARRARAGHAAEQFLLCAIQQRGDMIRAPGLALVDFTAAWCPPCRLLGPHVDAIARELEDELRVVKVDVDDQPDLAARFSVLSIPTLIFFRDGRPVDRIVGALAPAALGARVEELRRS